MSETAYDLRSRREDHHKVVERKTIKFLLNVCKKENKYGFMKISTG